MTIASTPNFDPELLLGRMRFIGGVRRRLEAEGYQEVATPFLQQRLSGFEKGTGFITFSASLGERLWLRAAPELYLKRLMIDGQPAGLDRIFEVASCLRDEFNELHPKDSFDRPEFTLLELYATQPDPAALEGLLRSLLAEALQAVKAGRLGNRPEVMRGCELLERPWRREDYGTLLRRVEPALDLEARLAAASQGKGTAGSAAAQAEAIAARANDAALRDAANALAVKAGSLARYLGNGPQGYWYDLLDHAFQVTVAPTLVDPVVVHHFPLESSPLAHSADGVHAEKWELYAGGVRVALAQRELMDAAAQRVRFEHLERLRRQGYELVPEPDESFVGDLTRWPAGKPLIGMGVYLDRLAGIALGLLTEGAAGQERMLPNLFKQGRA